MEISKIKETLGRHVNVESTKKEVTTLKMLLNNIEGLISQYRLELNETEMIIRKEEETLKEKKDAAYNNASIALRKVIDECNDKIDSLISRLQSLQKFNELEIRNLEQQKKELITKRKVVEEEIVERIEELNAKLAVAESKIYIFKDKESALKPIRDSIEDEESKLKSKKESMDFKIDVLDDVTNQIRQVNERIINDLQEARELAEEEKAVKVKRFEEECELFHNINEHSDLILLEYFEQVDLTAIVAIIKRVIEKKEHKSQVAALLAKSISDRTEVIAKIDALNNDLETVKQEREILKGKVAATTENIRGQVKETYGELKTVMAMAKAIGNFEEMMKDDDKVDANTKASSTASEDNTDSTISTILSNLANGIINEYANQDSTSEEKQKSSGALDEVSQIFGKRK